MDIPLTTLRRGSDAHLPLSNFAVLVKGIPSPKIENHDDEKG
jgi:hypothetical protein